MHSSGSPAGKSSAENMNQIKLSPRLLNLIRAPQRLTAQRLWRALEARERADTLAAATKLRANLVKVVARKLKFRVETVKKLNDAKFADWTERRRVQFPNAMTAELLGILHLEWRRELLRDLYDALGVEHDNGEISPGFGDGGGEPRSGGNEARSGTSAQGDQPELTEAKVYAAADAIEQEYGLRRTVVLLLAHMLPPGAQAFPGAVRPEHYGFLWGWLGKLSESPESDSGDPEPIDGETEAEADDEGADGRSFPTLDHLLIEAVNASREGTLGSLSEEEIDDAVEELASLNQHRPHSFFHVGLRDVVFERSPGTPMPKGRSKVRWYWAGKISGWGQSELWAEIVSAYDGNDIVQTLGDGSDGASERAAPFVVAALGEEGRGAEVAEFVQGALLKSGTFETDGYNRRTSIFKAVLDIGTDLLHNGEVGRARAIFDRLMEAVRAHEEDGEAPALQLFLDVRRRRAHCLQRSLEHRAARQRLKELLKLDPYPNHQAMVHADLGMLKGSFNSLEEVELPGGEGDLADFLERLREGRDHFQESVDAEARYGAHGHYCLGVLALGESVAESTEVPAGEDREARCAEAVEHFIRARSVFESSVGSYGSLVARTRLYLGIAQAVQAESAGNLTQAAKLIEGELGGKATLPGYFVDPVVEGLSLATEAGVLGSFLSALLKTGGNAVLDAIARDSSVLATSEECVSELRERARRLGASEAAARDLRSCLACYLDPQNPDAQNLDAACDILDQLEGLAKRGVGAAQFEELLAEKRYEPAWEAEDAILARVRCQEARDAYGEALVLLRKLFHQVAGDRLEEAEGIIAKLRSYHIPKEQYEAEVGRLRALKQQDRGDEDEPTNVPGKRVRVLFVGGDEGQAKTNDNVEKLVKSSASNVAVTFVPTGWSGGWSQHLDKVRTELTRHDVVVLSTRMRTELGRQIRTECRRRGKEWRSCWVQGRKGRSNAILQAARAVAPSG